jgi:hypothetical protein
LGNVRHHYYRGIDGLRKVVTREPASEKDWFKKQEQANAST